MKQPQSSLSLDFEKCGLQHSKVLTVCILQAVLLARATAEGVGACVKVWSCFLSVASERRNPSLQAEEVQPQGIADLFSPPCLVFPGWQGRYFGHHITIKKTSRCSWLWSCVLCAEVSLISCSSPWGLGSHCEPWNTPPSHPWNLITAFAVLGVIMVAPLERESEFKSFSCFELPLGYYIQKKSGTKKG
jgi:hypothetical protein